MSATREQVFAALFGLFAPLADQFVTLSRRFKMWDATTTLEQPALFQREGNQGSQDTIVGLGRITYKAQIFIYCQVPIDSASVPATSLNPLIDAVLNAIQPQVGVPQMLGGLVTNCTVAGEIFVYDGLLPNDTLGIAVIPVLITTGQ